MEYRDGNLRGAYIFIACLALICFGVCILGRRKIKLFCLKTKEIFTSFGWMMIFLGVLLGIVGLVYEWGYARLSALFQERNPFLLGADPGGLLRLDSGIVICL